MKIKKIKIVCNLCGKKSAYHHEFEPNFPKYCTCDVGGWNDFITEICKEYVGDGVQYCSVCSHNKECHFV